MGFNKEIIQREDQGPIVKLFGELDIYSSSDFKEELIDILHEYSDDVYLDFTDLEYIDSTGLGALIAILKETKEIEKKIYLKNVNERIRKLFKITQLEDMFIFEGGI